MRSLAALLGVVVIVGVLPPPVSATPLTLQYHLTITQRCGTSPGTCSAVSIGGLPLTLTTDDTINRRVISPDSSWAFFGPTTVSVDTSVLGDFANPFTPDSVFTEAANFLVNSAFGFTFVSVGDQRVEVTDLGNTTQTYLVLRILEFGRDVVPGTPADPTSADIANLLAQDLRYQQIVYAVTCSPAGGNPCVYDSRSFDASGTATFREVSAPVPEPATGVLFGLGLTACAAARRRRRISARPQI